jgi:type I restriction enzyme, S subunit
MEYTITNRNWLNIRLGDFAERITKGGTPTTYGYSFQEKGINFIKVENIRNGNINIRSITDFISAEAHSFQSKSQLSDGNILFSIAGTIGETCIVKKEHLPANTNQALAIIKGTSKYIIPGLLRYQLDAFVAKVRAKARGGAMNNVSLDDLKRLFVNIPPPNEQFQLLAKMEELFSSLDKGIESLKIAQQQLKVYRQAVLKWAFEGNWKVSEFGAVAEIKRGKSKHRPRDAKELLGGPYPFLQTGEVRAANGGTIKTYSEIGLAQSKLWPKGTLCLTIAANIAETAFLGFDACFPDSVVGIKTDENNLSIRFANYYIQKLKQEIDSKASATAQKNINVEFLERLPIPIPPMKEQHTVVSEIESRLSVCDKIEESIEQSLKQAESLRQSILKKAFEGKLVPQDPNDEPASVLLDRIRAERENKPNPSPLRGEGGVRVKSYGEELKIRAKGLRKNRPGG